MLPVSQRTWARLIAGGCAWWVALAFGRTGRMADMLGTSETEVRVLGARDLVSGLALVLARDPRPALGARVALDLSDAVRHGRGRPAVLAMTLGFAGLSALGLLARRP